jgi:hypothetical protein
LLLRLWLLLLAVTSPCLLLFRLLPCSLQVIHKSTVHLLKVGSEAGQLLLLLLLLLLCPSLLLLQLLLLLLFLQLLLLLLLLLLLQGSARVPPGWLCTGC